MRKRKTIIYKSSGSALISIVLATGIISVMVVLWWNLTAKNLKTYTELGKTVSNGLSPTPPVDSSDGISSDEAIQIIKNLEEVKGFLNLVPDCIIEVDSTKDSPSTWSVHVYEMKDSHTATFNWFDVDKKTGKVTKLFDILKQSE